MSLPSKQLYSRLIANWPVDRLRPHARFQENLHARLERDFGGDSSRLDTMIKATTQPDIPNVPRSTRDPQAQWDALASLMDNAYFYKYPMTTKTTEPTKNPDYYLILLKEMEEAPDRTWFGSFLNSWKGFIRWQ